MMASSRDRESQLPASKTFPHPTSTLPFWRTEPSILDEFRSTSDLPPTSDIVIIGSGMTGVSIAYHLLKTHDALYGESEIPPQPPSISLLEARTLCSGATGRNGGHTKLAAWYMQSIVSGSSFLLPVSSPLESRIAAANELADFQLKQIDALNEVVDQEGIRDDCEFLLTRSFDVFSSEEAGKERIEDLLLRRKQGISAAKTQVQVLNVDGSEGEKVCRLFYAPSFLLALLICSYFELSSLHFFPRYLVPEPRLPHNKLSTELRQPCQVRNMQTRQS